MNQKEKSDLNDAFLNCVQKGDLAGAKENLRLGASIHAQDKRHTNALIFAAYCNHPEMVRFLLSHGISKDHVDNVGNTAFIWAVRSKNVEVIHILLSQNVNVNVQNDDKNSALSFAIDNQGLFEELLSSEQAKAFDLNLKAEHGYSLLIDAVKNNRQYAFKKLLSLHPDLEIKDDDGDTVLAHAVRSQRTDFIRDLVEAGANIRSENKRHRTPIDYASVAKWREMEKYLEECHLKQHLEIFKKGFSRPVCTFPRLF